MPWHTAESTPWLWRLLVPGSPSRPGQHRSREDHQGSGRRGEPGSKAESYGSGEQATSYLGLLAKARAHNEMARLTLQDVEADAAQPVDVWVVDLGKEADLGWGHGVVVWEEQFELEDAAYMMSASH
jgi:hypothetical protein